MPTPKKIYLPLTGIIDARNPRDRGDLKRGDVFFRENLYPRDGKLQCVGGIYGVITTALTGRPTWSARYHTVETGQVSPKTFCYTQDGKLWYIDEAQRTATEIETGLKKDAYPKHWLYKSQTQTFLYLVDGENLYKYDGNNDNNFEIVDIETADGDTINPIDVIEHLDRLCLISETTFYISKNLDPDTFDDSTDSLEVIVGSGKGKNINFGKIGDTLFIMNTEAKFKLIGDTISAQAITFDIEPIETFVNNITRGRTAVSAESAIYFLAQDLEVYRFNGLESTKVSHYAKLSDKINPYADYLDMAVGTHEDNFYKLSFVETGYHRNGLEYWYDTVEERDTYVRGRDVACYMQTDPSVELPFQMVGRTTKHTLCYVNRGKDFDGTAIRRRLWTKDVILKKNYNCRILNVYIDMEATGPSNFDIYYILDGRRDPVRSFTQSTEGEYRDTQFPDIHILNQDHFTGRAQLRVNYAKGESISFYIDDSSQNADITIKGITIEFVIKELKKLSKVGG
jgi:hypothetical protein